METAQGLAEELSRRADDYERMVANYTAAAASERRLEQALAPLRNQGFHVLADRTWPGRRDLKATVRGVELMIGPAVVERILDAGRRPPGSKIERVRSILMSADSPTRTLENAKSSGYRPRDFSVDLWLVIWNRFEI